MGACRRCLEGGSNSVSVVTININYCRLLAVSVDLTALRVNLTYVLGSLTNGVYSDQPGLTAKGTASYPVANGLTLAATKAAIQPLEPAISFVGGDALLL